MENRDSSSRSGRSHPILSPEAALATITAGNDELRAEIADLRTQLAKARQKPRRVALDLLLYRLLSFLARQSPPLSASAAARFQKSARKRNPVRSLPEAMRAAEEETARQQSAHAIARVRKAGGRARTADPSKRTVMVVSHEASRTGAPILALNIARILAEENNVVSVVLGAGAILDDFRALSVATYELNRHSMTAATVSTVIRDICAGHPLSYAIVNSIESRKVFAGLKAAGLPSVALVHEFASYTRPRSAFPEVFRDADQVIFSTRITLENAIEECGLSRGAFHRVLPQGKCVVPGGDRTEDERSWERGWLDGAMRPSGAHDREFVVLGAGTVEPRKAVDLFLECATRAIRAPGGGRFRFVWIGGGYNPDKGTTVSVYLADQIRRAGIQSQVSIIRPTSEIEHAYRQADALLLSSRLDPLPNVAIDALVAGTPVLCFEETTGIADFLMEAGVGAECVAPYLDTTDMAGKLHALADDRVLRDDVAERGRTAALARFDLDAYVRELDRIASNIIPADRQIVEDTDFLAEQGAFRADFFCPPGEVPADERTAIRAYLEANRSGFGMRKPCPGFNPAVYATRRDEAAGTDPFVRFLRAGAPAGPWVHSVIGPQSPTTGADKVGAALHVHVDDAAALRGLESRLAPNTARPDLFITIPEGTDAPSRATLDDLGWPVRDVMVVPPRGRALGSFLTGPGRRLADDYDVIGHVDLSSATGAERDLARILDNLIGGTMAGGMTDRILAAMAAEPALGLVYPDDPSIGGWGDSRAAGDFLAHRLGLGLLPDQIDFPADRMFWARSGLLRTMIGLGFGWTDYPAAEIPATGTVLDALPRILCVLPERDGLQTAVTYVGKGAR